VWVVRAIYWTRQSCGLTQGRQAPLAGCRAMWTNRRAVGSLDSPLEELTLRVLLPRQGLRGYIETALVAACFAHNYPACPSHALLTSCGCSSLQQGLPWWGRELGCEKQRCIWTRVASGWDSWGHAHGGHLHRQHIGRSSNLWWRQDCHSR